MLDGVLMSSNSKRLKIGVSACFFHPDNERVIFKGKTLQYVEQSVMHWVMSQGDLAVMIPSPKAKPKWVMRKLPTTPNGWMAWCSWAAAMFGPEAMAKK